MPLSDRVLRVAASIAFSRSMSADEYDAAREKGRANIRVTITSGDVLAARRLLNGSL